MSRHEVDYRRRNLFGSTDQIAFILTVFIINDYDHPSVANISGGVLDAGKSHDSYSRTTKSKNTKSVDYVTRKPLIDKP
jgi:hypothetical protein